MKFLYATTLSLILSTPYYAPAFAISAVIGVNGTIPSAQSNTGTCCAPSGTPVSPTCPFLGPGSGTNDGCAGAWGGAPQAYVAQNTILAFLDPVVPGSANTGLLADGTVFQNHTCTQTTAASVALARATNLCTGAAAMTWNVPGEQYAVGVNAPLACPRPTHCSTTPGATTLIDASDATYWSTFGGADTGCVSPSILTFSAGNGTNIGPSVNCQVANGATITFTGYDWTPNEGSVGGKTETCVAPFTKSKTGSTSGTVNFTHNHVHWLNHPSCNNPGFSGIGSVSGFLAFFATGETGAFNINISNNAIDGAQGQFYSQYALALGQASQFAFINANGTGAITFQYNYVHDVAQRIMDIGCGLGGVNESYNLIHNVNYSAATAHWEVSVYFANSLCTTSSGGVIQTMNNLTDINNVGIIDANGLSGFNMTAFMQFDFTALTANPNGLINTTDLEENLIYMNPKAYGMNGQATFTLAGETGCGSNACANDILTVNSYSGCASPPQLQVASSISATPTILMGQCGSSPPATGALAVTCIGHMTNTNLVMSTGACVGSYGSATLTIPAGSGGWTTTAIAGDGNFMTGAGGSTSIHKNTTINNNTLGTEAISTASAPIFVINAMCANPMSVGTGATANLNAITGATAPVAGISTGGNTTASAGWSIGATTITLPAGLNSTIFASSPAGWTVYNRTTGLPIANKLNGVDSSIVSYNNSTGVLTLNGGAENAGSTGNALSIGLSAGC